MRNLIMYKEGEKSWIRWIKKRIDNNLNFLAILEGPTGIGKSWNALSMAYDLDNDFDPSLQCAFSFLELMDVVNRYNDEANPLSKRKYKVIIFDESQTSIGKREWQSKINKLFGYLLSTFRHQNIIVLFTSPYSDFIDSASLKLIHAKFVCKGWSSKTKKSHVRPKLLQYNSRFQKFYEHSLFVIMKQRTVKLINWWIERPPESLIRPYEAKKEAFTKKLNEEITRELRQLEVKKSDMRTVEEKGLNIIPNTDYQKRVKDIMVLDGITDRKIVNSMLKEEGFYTDYGKLSKSIKRLRKIGVYI